MKIQIKPDLFIDVNESDFELYETGTTKTGKPSRKNHGYFNSLNAAVVKIVRLELVGKDETVDLAGFLTEYKKTLKSVSDILKI